MSERIRVGKKGNITIPKKMRDKHHINIGTILEVSDVPEGLLLKPHNILSDLKGIGKGVFGDPIEYQRKMRGNRELPG